MKHNAYQQITFLEDELDRLLHHSRILKKERIAIGKLIEFALIGAELREGLSSAIDLSLDYHIYKEEGPGGDMCLPYRINISTYHTPAPKKNYKNLSEARCALKKYLTKLKTLLYYTGQNSDEDTGPNGMERWLESCALKK